MSLAGLQVGGAGGGDPAPFPSFGQKSKEITKELKGPKCEIFDSGFFALIRPIWIGDLGTRPKNYKF